MADPLVLFPAAPPPGRARRRRWSLVAALVAVAGLGVLAALVVGGGSPRVVGGPPPAPPVPAAAVLPGATPGTAGVSAVGGAQGEEVAWVRRVSRAPVSAGDGTRFVPVYREAARRFAVSWLLLASIHRQETAFSTAPSTYHGLNFAHCCAGPMQFNLTNGPVSTWKLFRTAFRYGIRPATYPHQTIAHPSVYDDFDAIMAAAWLLRSDGAGPGLGGSAWQAAYDYYGHDDFGTVYADQVLARALSWARHGFCPDCEPSARLVNRIDARWGAPARALLPPSAPARHRGRHRARRHRRPAARRPAATHHRAAPHRTAPVRRPRARPKHRSAPPSAPTGPSGTTPTTTTGTTGTSTSPSGLTVPTLPAAGG